MNHIPLKVDPVAVETALEQVSGYGSETAKVDGVRNPEEAVVAGGDVEESQNTDTSSGRPGVDVLLRNIREQLGDESYEVARGMQRDFTTGGEIDAKSRRLDQAISDVEALKSELEIGENYNTEEDHIGNALQNADPGQIAMLERWAENEGFVRRVDLDNEDRNYMADDANTRGIEMFGDDFGKEVNGEFELNPVAKEKMAPIFDRLTGDQALDFLDLYQIANFDALMESAKVQGRNEAIEEIRTKQNGKADLAQRLTGVAVRNTGGSTSPVFYNPEEYKDKPTVSGFQKISDTISKVRRTLAS